MVSDFVKIAIFFKSIFLYFFKDKKYKNNIKQILIENYIE